MLTLYTPATGFPDLDVKIAYGLTRVGIEAFGIESVAIHYEGGFYRVTFDIDKNDFEKLNKMFNLLCQRLLFSTYIPFSTPGIAGRSAESVTVNENESFSLDFYKSFTIIAKNKKGENVCRHEFDHIGNVIGFTVATSFHNKRDGVDIQLQYKNPKDKNSPKLPRRPTNPKNICKTCGLLALLGIWYTSFIFNVARKEVIVIPIPKGNVSGRKLQEIFALQHQIRKEWFNQDIPQVLIPLVFLSKIPSSADILKGFDLFIAILSRKQGYHVDRIFLIPIENYLKFIRGTPYNIATIDNILTQKAYAALQELNNTIYNLNKTSILKFARLYVQETSPKKGDWVNLLYPETVRYLLKEVAMISLEIIENPALGSLARTLRYFIREKKYGYADDIRNARKESRDFEETIAKMLREGRLRLEQKEQIHLPTDEEVKKVFRLANEDFESTKLALVMLAFSFPSRTEETMETLEEIQGVK
ncbi:type I-A CRISPR-associated protein Csa5 [Thermodesulfovibrio yellowstonii]|uniref:CRISPR-associated protein, Csa5 family n=2 Tax=Thermodesulfovibrio yellowstonii TaxID=28262 RepID=B5YL05_THEYD|nr:MULTISPECIES: type I-A CRISPR-associated protein Csa5 [Thermodesulfovibrio]ACI21287.1 CRISPR-associated protein, Csa5 family [Thermodesulfovibrio yellowstonii DSM 11347]MDI6864137.1 type I-A CRISPR-associated protein Csa5 [Thermodesulfovibrio yellowstonii]GLI53643.1 type I-A CRISPR-associated protein Csa5 [Thermodesulfovibrio islandicus]